MDALSRLLENVHLCETKYYSLKGTGNWSYSITKKDTILFYLVMSGSFCINVGSNSRKAYTGDMIMIPNAHHHVCYALEHHGDNAKPLNYYLLNGEKHSIELYDDDYNSADNDKKGTPNSCLV